MKSALPIILGVTGASGVVYGRRALTLLCAAGVEVHLVVTKAAEMTIRYELSQSLAEFSEGAAARYVNSDIGAPIASGSFRTSGMLIAPCSIKSMSEISTGVTSALVSRAADVVLKEHRRLVLMVRETPLHTGHLRTLTNLSEIGAIIAPPSPAFYAEPSSVDDMVTQSVSRVLDLFDIDAGSTKRWGEDLEKGKRHAPSSD